MGNILFLILLFVPFLILLGIIHSIISLKIETKFFKIKQQSTEELEVRIVHHKKEKIVSVKELFYILVPIKENNQEFHYYLTIPPHVELKVSERDYIQLSGKRFIRVVKQEVKVEAQSPWYWQPWLFILFNPEIKKIEKELVSYKLL